MRPVGLLPLVLVAGLAAMPALAQSTVPDGGRISKPEPGIVDPDRFGDKPGDAAYGAYQRGHYLTALELATPRALKGDPAAQTLVGEIYSRGLGVKRDIAKAAEWYGKAAEQGVPAAQFALAMILLEAGPEFRDAGRAYKLMQAAADAGNRLAQFNFAQMIPQRDPTAEGMARAVSYYERAAEAGLPEAQYAMAQVHTEGLGGRKADPAKALEWLTLAAQQNFDTAQIDLGTMLVEGRGGEGKAEDGFAWLLRAAQAGNPAAQNRVAKLYRAGVGVERNTIASAAWYMIARSAGLVDPLMEDHLMGLTEEQLTEAREKVEMLQ